MPGKRRHGKRMEGVAVASGGAVRGRKNATKCRFSREIFVRTNELCRVSRVSRLL